LKGETKKEKIIYKKLGWNDKILKNKNYIKGIRTKIRNQKNKK
jgi:hypothetical protein